VPKKLKTETLLPNFNNLCTTLEEKYVKPNELKAGDKIKNTNAECKHYRSEGVVVGVREVKQKGSKDHIAGNIIKYKVTNSGDTFKPGDHLEKTEIQLSRA
jgi:hypothetical protein